MTPDPREIWEARYREFAGKPGPPERGGWLERHREILEGARGERVLDLGCGRGFDTRAVCDLEIPVAALDFAPSAVRDARRWNPGARFTVADLRDGLPFRAGTFPVVLANLCLHYFDRALTHRILDDVRRCLRPGGHLIGRMNAFDDTAHGAGEGEEIEPELFFAHGKPKRFCTRAGLLDLLGDRFRILSLEHREEPGYGQPKALFELVARADPTPAQS